MSIFDHSGDKVFILFGGCLLTAVRLVELCHKPAWASVVTSQDHLLKKLVFLENLLGFYGDQNVLLKCFNSLILLCLEQGSATFCVYVCACA